MWGASFPTQSALPAIIEPDRQTHRYLADFITVGQRDGSIRSDLDADAAAVVITGLARGAAALWLTHSGAADAAQLQRLCGEAIIALLGPASKVAWPRRAAAPFGGTEPPTRAALRERLLRPRRTREEQS